MSRPSDTTPPPSVGPTAESTWKKGFVHLTVDGEGLVSLWDHEVDTTSYLRLPLTKEQQDLIEATMNKNGHTP